MTEPRVPDVGAERQAAADRHEEQRDQEMLSYRAGMLWRLGDVSVEGARTLWPHMPDEALQEIVERAEARSKEGRKNMSSVWEAKDIVKRGAELFAENPSAIAREIWRMIEKEADGRTLGLSESTWVNGYATKARRLNETPEDDQTEQTTKPDTDRTAEASAPEATRGEEASSREDDPTEVHTPVPTPAPEAADAPPVDPPAASSVDVREEHDTVPAEGKRVYLGNGPNTLRAVQREDGTWAVEVSGVFDDAFLSTLLDHPELRPVP